MAFPTTNLTARWDFSNTATLFRNFIGTGVHTVTPAAGESVEVAEDTGDGSITDLILAMDPGGPLFRAATAPMKKGCLDFNGSADAFPAYTQTAGAQHNLDVFFNAGAKTVAVAFHPQSITNTSSDHTLNHRLLGAPSGNDYMGISMRDVTGVAKIRAWNFDSNHDVTGEITIAIDRTWIAVYTHDGTTLTLRITDDTGAVTTESVTSGNTGSMTPFFIVSPASVLYNGCIGEILTYDALVSGASLTDLESHLKAEWMTIAAGGGRVWGLSGHGGLAGPSRGLAA